MKVHDLALYRIVLADDHILFRQGLSRIIKEAVDLEVIWEAGDGAELLRLLDDPDVLIPHMVILDMSMPNLHGLEVIHEIRGKHPEIKILVLSMYKEYLHQVLLAGVNGYLLKEDADKELFSAIENIQQGRIHISPRLTKEISKHHASIPEPLTTREKEILNLIAEGKSNKEVAKLLFISVRTVESHRASVIGKLKLKGTANLVRYALEKRHL